MSVIPEIILHRVLVQGLRGMRQDPRILDALFKNLDQVTLQAIKDTILKETINFTINYPRIEELKTPTIALLLKNEQEAQTFLGDIMGAAPHYQMPDQDLAIDTLGGHAASESDLSGLPRKWLGGIQVAEIQYDSVNDITVLFWPESQRDVVSEGLEDFGGIPGLAVYVVDGTGAGQIHTIIDIDRNSLDIEGQFDPQLDSSSLVDIRFTDDTGLAVGEPSRVYPAGATNLYRRGANYDVQYQLSVIAGHQDEVLYLYSVLKAILFSQKYFMEDQGLFALKISGSDFAPRTEYLPNDVFQRVMILQFTYPFSFLEEIESYEQIEASLTPTATTSTGLILDDCGPIQINIDFSSTTTI
jgi:hypothetical protein